MDAAGNAYVVGSTFTADFPTTPGVFQPNLKTGATQQLNDVFILKLNPTGSALVYSTFLGGSDDDIGLGIALDPAGNAYVCGMTRSKDFPVTSGAFQTVSQEVASSAYTGCLLYTSPSPRD